MTIAAGETITAADINAIKDDVDAIVSGSRATVSTSESTSSTSYTNLSTTGPSITATTGTAVLVIVTAQLSNSTANQKSFMGFDVSGATTSAATSNDALYFESDAANQDIRCSMMALQTVNAGSNTFTAKYRVDGGTGTFANRQIIVIPLGA